MALVCGEGCQKWEICLEPYQNSVEGISFYSDLWCSNIPLARLFPILYEPSCVKSSTVADNFISFGTGSERWFLGIDIDNPLFEPASLISL